WHAAALRGQRQPLVCVTWIQLLYPIRKADYRTAGFRYGASPPSDVTLRVNSFGFHCGSLERAEAGRVGCFSRNGLERHERIHWRLLETLECSMSLRGHQSFSGSLA